ncbi:MAG: beta-lactamase family protein [Bacteroidales bacterium]|nr:beta-lactamase family protein [Bacteroidales bacterium]
MRNFMQEWQLKGVSLAVMRGDSLYYAKGFGWADQQKEVEMAPGHILRVASVSKLITAAGIMRLQEMGKLSLQDKVFGPEGILKDSTYLQSISDRNYYRITVEDLLRHKGGLTTTGGDPMFSTRSIMANNHLKEAPDHKTLLRLVLRRKLGFVPGTSQSYSNLGFLLLSMVIEEVTGETYEDWIQENILHPAGCRDMHIAHNYYKEKYKNEVRNYVPSNEPLYPEYNNSGRKVERCYGGNDITALSGAGAWVASPAELALFVASIDGRPEIPDILTQESIDAMTEYFDKDTFSFGWNDTNPAVGWTRSGTFSGTSALIKYFPDGECWIFVTNTSTWKGPSFSRITATLFSELRRGWGDKFPKQDLFHE